MKEIIKQFIELLNDAKQFYTAESGIEFEPIVIDEAVDPLQTLFQIEIIHSKNVGTCKSTMFTNVLMRAVPEKIISDIGIDIAEQQAKKQEITDFTKCYDDQIIADFINRSPEEQISEKNRYRKFLIDEEHMTEEEYLGCTINDCLIRIKFELFDY